MNACEFSFRLYMNGYFPIFVRTGNSIKTFPEGRLRVSSCPFTLITKGGEPAAGSWAMPIPASATTSTICVTNARIVIVATLLKKGPPARQCIDVLQKQTEKTLGQKGRFLLLRRQGTRGNGVTRSMDNPPEPAQGGI